jgi:rubrerythrin
MIREILPDVGGQTSERAISMYRMWHCFDCGLDFTMKTRERPVLCPICVVRFDDEHCKWDALS